MKKVMAYRHDLTDFLTAENEPYRQNTSWFRLALHNSEIYFTPEHSAQAWDGKLETRIYHRINFGLDNKWGNSFSLNGGIQQKNHH